MAITTKSIVDVFKNLASSHQAVKWFDYGTAEFLFDPQVDLKYPAIFLQLTGAQIVDKTREERTFTLYSLYQTPDSFDYSKTTDFDYHEELTEERDSSLQTLRDIIGKAYLDNQKDWIVEEGSMVFDNDTFSSAVGWRLDFTIATVADYDEANFPD